MSPDIQTLISYSEHQDLLTALAHGQTQQALALIEARLPAAALTGLGRLWSRVKPGKTPVAPLFLRVLREGLVGNAIPELALPLQAEYTADVAELGRAIRVLEYSNAAPSVLAPLAAALRDWLKAGAAHIQRNAGDYPRNGINGKIWMDGAVLQAWAGELGRYYARQHDAANEHRAWHACGQLTMAIMAHYHHMVGPVMISMGQVLEKLNRPAEAAAHYRAVVADFTVLLDDLEEVTQAAGAAAPDEFATDYLALTSLRDAYAGLQRTEAGDEASLRALRSRLDQALAHWPQETGGFQA
ncbi:hypothetical protein LJ737_15995 [Hymenobacter sp. 15J16-1T3B]|uniref:hypothetical protein n=1 Tax=Hymenobacter sp. 15J16-1T3B TaxID=2886941 RepID=UPI001D10D1F7|nr:hypothetical protein [Hymenobacter sp. 15J16-1T3B]MCC3158747.1 hypothetical protein [Hymenobacter sp. 15J16-1T3B]